MSATGSSATVSSPTAVDALGAGAQARYNCLTFCGPGQGLALVDQNLHCEPTAAGLRNQRIFDCLDTTLG